MNSEQEKQKKMIPLGSIATRGAVRRKSKNKMVSSAHGNIDEMPVFLVLLHLKKQ
ncbi:MAG: hypothetical protein ACLQBD_30945 [Syntrophobacteraceae bacterium]